MKPALQLVDLFFEQLHSPVQVTDPTIDGAGFALTAGLAYLLLQLVDSRSEWTQRFRRHQPSAFLRRVRPDFFSSSTVDFFRVLVP